MRLPWFALPDYNLIELVWHSAKEYIAHRLFESVEQLEELLNQLLNQGSLIIKWERKIKNKGNAVYSIKLLRSLIDSNLKNYPTLVYIA